MYKILLGVPSSGLLHESAAQASWLASLKHLLDRVPSCLSGPNFNAVWCGALNAGMQKKYTHFAMMHTDLAVVEDEEGYRWLDKLMEEMFDTGAHFISTPMAIKDIRGLTSSGIGNPANRWNPYKRFTVKELAKLPQTFSIADTAFPDKFLLHNHALCLFDLRWPGWYETDDKGSCRAVFNFVEDIRLEGDQWNRYVESEDWLFSRNLWEMGAKTFITSRIKVEHHGGLSYSNYGDAGIWDADEDTAAQWRGERVLS